MKTFEEVRANVVAKCSKIKTVKKGLLDKIESAKDVEKFIKTLCKHTPKSIPEELWNEELLGLKSERKIYYNFEGCDLSKMDFPKQIFGTLSLTSCDASNAKLPDIINGTLLMFGCLISKNTIMPSFVDWLNLFFDADVKDLHIIKSTACNKLDICGATISDITINSKCTLRSCKISNVDFQAADVHLQSCELSAIKFPKQMEHLRVASCNIEHIKLPEIITTMVLSEVDYASVDLPSIITDAIQLWSCNLDGVTLGEYNFEIWRCNVSQTTFPKSNFVKLFNCEIDSRELPQNVNIVDL